MQEKDIIYERDGFYITRGYNCFIVFRPAPSFTYAFTDCAFFSNEDGLSLAKARVDYLARMAAL